MLTLYKRHSKECAEIRRRDGAAESVAELRADRGYRRCTCPIHPEGTLRLDGFIRKATGEVKWPKAEEIKEVGGCRDARRRARRADRSRPPRTAHNCSRDRTVFERPEGLQAVAEHSQKVPPVYGPPDGVLRGEGRRLHHAVRHRSGPCFSGVLVWFADHEPQAAGTYEVVFRLGSGAALD